MKLLPHGVEVLHKAACSHSSLESYREIIRLLCEDWMRTHRDDRQLELQTISAEDAEHA